MATERGKLRLAVNKTRGFYQLSIEDDKGGYRIAGPKFDGSNVGSVLTTSNSSSLLSRKRTKSDWSHSRN